MPTIVAKCGDVKATVCFERPRWEDMLKHYPSEDIDTEDLYDEIGGGLPKLLKENPKSWENSCTIRMSRGLNYSRMSLPKAPSIGGTIKGKDGYNYWIRVNDMVTYLERKFGIPEVTEAGGESAVDKFKGRKGIIFFRVTGWHNATGHVTLWDGTDLSYAPGHNSLEYHPELYYFQMQDINDEGKTTKTTEVQLWELK
jgi:hypothetical protein